LSLSPCPCSPLPLPALALIHSHHHHLSLLSLLPYHVNALTINANTPASMLPPVLICVFLNLWDCSLSLSLFCHLGNIPKLSTQALFCITAVTKAISSARCCQGERSDLLWCFSAMLFLIGGPFFSTSALYMCLPMHSPSAALQHSTLLFPIGSLFSSTLHMQLPLSHHAATLYCAWLETTWNMCLPCLVPFCDMLYLHNHTCLHQMH